MFRISRIRDFINKERVYVLILSFIFLFNAWFILIEEVPWFAEGPVGKNIFKLRLASKEFEGEFVNDTRAYDDIMLAEVLKKGGHPATLINILGLVVLSVFSLGLFLDIRILMAKVRKREIFKIRGSHLKVRWGIKDIFRLAIIFVFLGYVLYIIEAQILLSVSGAEEMLHFLPILNTGIMDLVILGFIIYFVKVKYNHSLATIGLKIRNARHLSFLAVLSYIAFLPILAFLLLLLIWLTSLFNFHLPQQTLFRLFLKEENLWLLTFSTIMVIILGPIVEEIFFRGFSYNAIKRRWGVRPAFVLTAVVFAGLHGNVIGFLPIVALGLLLAYVYEKTASLIPSIIVHILHNTLMVSLLFLGRYFIHIAGR